VKLGLRRAQAISIVHAGLVIDRDDNGVVTSARLALGSVAPTVVLIDEFAEALVGSPLTDESIAAASIRAVEAIAPISDGRATADYRNDGTEVMIRRAASAIAAGTQASMWPTDPPTLSTAEQLFATAPVGTPTLDAASEISVSVNRVPVTGPGAGLTLLDWVRDVAGQTGMKEGCAEGECGACTMILDGVAVMSCLVAAGQADQAEVTTVEGLGDDGSLHPVQRAFVDDFAVQCGFCIPGFIVASASLLAEVHDPSVDDIRLGLSGNLCRCTGYYPIMQAVQRASVVPVELDEDVFR